MSKTLIGLVFILVGVVYGCMAIDGFYNKTLGYLTEHGFIKPPQQKNSAVETFGRKTTIIFYSLALIGIGIYLIWNRNI
jgi:multisubunit Na+/H+ antiporter MnhC subunit